jgi:hypothetical protein
MEASAIANTSMVFGVQRVVSPGRLVGVRIRIVILASLGSYEIRPEYFMRKLDRRSRDNEISQRFCLTSSRL